MPQNVLRLGADGGLTAVFPLVFSHGWPISFRVPVFVKWLMICATLAGLGMRAAPHIHAYSHPHCHGHGHHHPGGHLHHEDHGACADFHLDGSGDDHSPDPDGVPGEHHHQHVCCHISPLAVEGADASRLSLLDFSLIGVMSEGIRVPAEPVFELDTPPLI